MAARKRNSGGVKGRRATSTRAAGGARARAAASRATARAGGRRQQTGRAKRPATTAKGRPATRIQRGARAGGAAKQRQPRSDRLDAGQKFSAKMVLKFTPAGRDALTHQARVAGFDSDSAYLRWLAGKDRHRLQNTEKGRALDDFDYQPAAAEMEHTGTVATA